MRLLGVICLLLLTACAAGWDLAELKSANPQITDFNGALAREYQDLAEAEADKYDWNNSGYFARKGLAALNGEAAPENPENWNVPADELSKLEDAREKLLHYLTEKNKRKNPVMLARAQGLYDCWVEEQEKALESEHIDLCRDEFFASLKQLK